MTMKTYTTGDIAEICDVNQRTVIRWIERGELLGFKLPGRGNNRVTEESLLDFLNRHNIPVPEEIKPEAGNQILIVDDEPAVAKAIQRVLRGAGYSTEIAFDGFKAGSALVRNKPVLMTLDLKMPGIDGFEVIQQVRSHSDMHDTAILVISSVEETLLKRAVLKGADGYLHKPFNNDELVEKIKRLIAAKASRDK